MLALHSPLSLSYILRIPLSGSRRTFTSPPLSACFWEAIRFPFHTYEFGREQTGAAIEESVGLHISRCRYPAALCHRYGKDSSPAHNGFFSQAAAAPHQDDQTGAQYVAAEVVFSSAPPRAGKYSGGHWPLCGCDEGGILDHCRNRSRTSIVCFSIFDYDYDHDCDVEELVGGSLRAPIDPSSLRFAEACRLRVCDKRASYAWRWSGWPICVNLP